ncbi:AAA family ATPase, partial [Spiroplasma endosymbiont of Lariophagus distinguendus]|uniref:AAA family ATPase n=1 Tax=Spiroplasma endosymbiont of Lariophagus distinguendus TaxID=2935082 RepID=UPI00207AA607
SDSNRTNIRSLKDKLARQAKKCFTNIFKNFTVNVIPEIVIDDQIFQIIIRGKENRYFSTSETIYQSSGFKAFLWLIIMLEVVKDWDKNRYGRTILLVDEPDKSLHILLQYELANYLKLNFTNNNNVFILMTSHSPFLIPNLNENIYIADMNEEGKTTLIKAKNVNNIRNSGIFPLITLFHMEKLRDELFENIKEDLIRIYFENQKNDDLNKKIENFIHNIILNKFNYSLIQINNAEQKHINEIRTHEMFSKFIYNIDDLYKLITDEHIKTKKDIYLTEKFIKSILSDDILNSINKSKE